MSTATRLQVPENGAARLFSTNSTPGFGWGVAIANSWDGARPEAVLEKATVSALLSHDEGLTWPDRFGEQIAIETLKVGGTALLVFVTMADAIAFKSRLTGGAA